MLFGSFLGLKLETHSTHNLSVKSGHIFGQIPDRIPFQMTLLAIFGLSFWALLRENIPIE